MGGKAHLVHVDLEIGVVGRRIGPVCDPVGAIDPGGLAIAGGSDLLLVHDLVPWPSQGYLAAVLDHVLLPSATFEPLLPGGLFAEMRLLEELLLLMPW